MDKTYIRFAGRVGATTVCAALGALAPLPAAVADPAADAAVAELTQPRSVVEVGGGAVSQDSAKFGEYNGLDTKGAYGIGNFDLRGGGRYDSESAERWRIRGTDLGLDTRSLNAEYGQQGSFRLTFGYDELRHDLTNGYQTPYQGVGSAVLTLPGNWILPVVPRLSGTSANARGLSPDVAAANGLVSGKPTAPTSAQLATSAALIAADTADFREATLHTQRIDTDAGLSYQFASHWELTASVRHENRNGTKPMGSVTRATGGDISTIIPDFIDQTTDQFNAAISYRGKKAYAQFYYYGSAFTNDAQSMSWANWALPTATATMSSAPDNHFSQVGTTASYAFTATTRLVANLQYGRGTQDKTFLVDSSTPLVPVPSLDGLVVTKTANLRLTTKPTRDLSLALGYKYDDRDNQSPVHIFGFYDANQSAGTTNANSAWTAYLGLAPNALTDAINLNANVPYSKKLSQATLDADYFLGRGQWLKGAYERQSIDHYCNGTWISCVEADSMKEDILRLEWRGELGDRVSTRLAYLHGDRTVDNYNENSWLAYVPMANVSPTGATGGATPYSFMVDNGWTGYGPVAGYAATTGNLKLFFPSNNALANSTYANGNRISELIGMRRFDMADRLRDKGTWYLDWQATDSTSVTAKVDYTDDRYSKSIYGLQSARALAATIDGAYAASENLTATLFYTYENLRSQSAGNSYSANSSATSVNGFAGVDGGCFTTIKDKNYSAKIDPCLNWSADMRDVVHTLGLSLQRSNLKGGKLDLRGDVTLTHGDTDNAVAGGNYVNNPQAVTGAPAGTIAAYFIPATSLPTVKDELFEIRLLATYRVDQNSYWRFGYAFDHRDTSDWAYDGLQFGGLSGVLPTLQVAPHYSVHTVAIAYARRF